MKVTFLICTLCVIQFGCNLSSEDKARKHSSVAIMERKMNDFYFRDNYDSAIRYLNALIAIDSSNGDYFFKRGYSFSEVGNRKQSVADYHKAVELNYRVSDAYLNIGLSYMYRNDSLALQYFEKSLQVDPSNKKAATQLFFSKKILADKKLNKN